MLEKAFGPEQAASLMERLSKSLKTQAFEFIRKADISLFLLQKRTDKVRGDLRVLLREGADLFHDCVFLDIDILIGSGVAVLLILLIVFLVLLIRRRKKRKKDAEAQALIDEFGSLTTTAAVARSSTGAPRSIWVRTSLIE